MSVIPKYDLLSTVKMLLSVYGLRNYTKKRHLINGTRRYASFYCIFALGMARKLTNKLFALTALLTLSITAAAQELRDSVHGILPDTIVIPHFLKARLDSLSYPFDDEPDITFDDISDNPLYYKLFMPLVLYSSAVSEAISPDRNDMIEQDNLLPLAPLESGNDYTLARMIDEALVRIYLEHPELVKMTEAELMDVPGIIPISEEMASGIRLKDTRASGYGPSEDKSPAKVSSRQRYWKTFGNFQGKYTQSYYSDNWYKGGESNHSILGQINLEADYAKNQTTFDNKLELKLGYYNTAQVNGKNTFRTNEDLIRFTSKYGLKAFENWYYSAQYQGYTQFAAVYDPKDATKLKSKFFAPAYGNLSVGMDYKPIFKKKGITLSVLLSPFSYNCKYVSVDSIATDFGIDAGKNFKSTIGSRFDANLKWTFLEDFTWTSKTQYYTTYKSTEINLENTIDYRLTKYLSLQFFCHWRFDDSVNRKKDKNGNLMGYGQFKEFLTLNFNYAW